MGRIIQLIKRTGLIFLMLLAAGIISVNIVQAGDISEVADGTYTLKGSLSCYVPAMGGVEFGAPLLTDIKVTVKNGNADMKIGFRKSSVTIYGITCDTFIDSDSGKVGYYSKNGTLVTDGVTVVKSLDTALNPKNEAVRYVESVTFSPDEITDTYQLSLYVNSNVMGTQFGKDGGYPAKLTVDWSLIPGFKAGETTKPTTETKPTFSAQESATKPEINSSGSDAGQTDGNREETPVTDTPGAYVQDNNTAYGSVKAEDAAGSAGDNDSSQELKTAVLEEKEGLNIYYAANNTASDGDIKDSSKTDVKTDNQSKNKTGLVIVLAAVVCVLAAGGWYIWSKKKDE